MSVALALYVVSFTVVIKYLRLEFKFPAIIEFDFFSNISHHMKLQQFLDQKATEINPKKLRNIH